MAIVGIEIDKKNPAYGLDDFLFWMPQFENVMTNKYFEKMKEIANTKIYKSIYGSDWEYAMSLCIAHYMELLAVNKRIPKATSFNTLSGGASFKGTMSSMSVGSFSKSVELGNTLITNEDAFFWNQTSYGASLMALLKTKSVPTIFVVTGN